MLGNLDGFVVDKNIIVEAKTAKNRDDWGVEGTNNIPMDYLMQVAHYCHVYDVAVADIIVFFKYSEKFGLYRYERHSKFELNLIKKERNFWFNHVKKKNPPEITTIDQTKIAYSESNNKTIIVDEGIVRIHSLIQDEKFIINEAKKRKTKLDLEVRLKMGHNKIMTDNTGYVLATWNDGISVGFDKDQLKIDHPEIYPKYVRTKPKRTLLTKKVKLIKKVK